MRILRVLPLLLAIAVIWALNRPFGSLPAIGRIIDPVNGAMAAAEDYNENWNRSLQLKDLRAPVQIWMDTSLIPHIRAGNDHDLYYAQGYIHANFRLWQMDLQTRAAGGRVSEVAGPKAIEFDRGMRREGMVWGAQHSLAAMEAEPRTKAMLDAYRDGINAYIQTLNFRRLPLEYKLMGFYPEDWTNLRTALLMKYMARDLTGKTDDIAYTRLRDQLGQEQFDFLFPERIKGSKPVIPEGTKWEAPSMAVPKAPGGEVWAHFDTLRSLSKREAGIGWPKRFEEEKLLAKTTDFLPEDNNGNKAIARRHPRDEKLNNESRQFLSRDDECNGASLNFLPQDDGFVRPLWVNYLQDNDCPASREANYPLSVYANSFSRPETAVEDGAIGSNNWAISGKHTASGKPILCNDPHLALNLPSLWYEMQLTAPGINAYGASLPGAPGIVIGFNEKISWGFTNNYRDVKDFYEIDMPDCVYKVTPKLLYGKKGFEFYQFAKQCLPFERSIEVIKVKGKPDVIDTVLYTNHGPVTYDPSFPDEAKSGKLLACTWMAHRGSNELIATYLLNRAGDYPAFTDAISHFECPAQNIAYADGAGNIAMWGQGRFINKWKDQGKYVMRGDDSSTLWGAAIPMSENPHVLNPPQGYVASANQQVTDSTYPYWYNGRFVEWRSWEINENLEALNTLGSKQVAIPIRQQLPCWDSFFALPYPFLYLDKMQNDVSSLLLAELSQRNLFTSSKGNADAIGKLFSESEIYQGGAVGVLKAQEKFGSYLQIFWSQLYKDIWQDEFPTGTKYPSSELTVQLLLSDSTSRYYDDKRTQQVETLREIVQRAFRETTDSLNKLQRAASNAEGIQREASNGLEWYKVKNTSLTHLAKIPAFSYDHLKIGGWSNTINAVSGNHGPSWRMIVEMDSIPRAYAIYPGGQSGNPGSRHYSDFIDQWVEGKYHAIQFFTAAIAKNPLPYTWTLTP